MRSQSSAPFDWHGPTRRRYDTRLNQRSAISAQVMFVLDGANCISEYAWMVDSLMLFNFSYCCTCWRILLAIKYTVNSIILLFMFILWKRVVDADLFFKPHFIWATFARNKDEMRLPWVQSRVPWRAPWWLAGASRAWAPRSAGRRCRAPAACAPSSAARDCSPRTRSSVSGRESRLLPRLLLRSCSISLFLPV